MDWENISNKGGLKLIGAHPILDKRSVVFCYFLPEIGRDTYSPQYSHKLDNRLVGFGFGRI